MYNNKFLKHKQYCSSLCFETNERNMKNNEKLTSKHKPNDALQDDIKTNTKQMNNLVFLTDQAGKQTRIIDNGGSSHISNCKDLFTEIKSTELTNVANEQTKSQWKCTRFLWLR